MPHYLYEVSKFQFHEGPQVLNSFPMRDGEGSGLFYITDNYTKDDNIPSWRWGLDILGGFERGDLMRVSVTRFQVYKQNTKWKYLSQYMTQLYTSRNVKGLPRCRSQTLKIFMNSSKSISLPLSLSCCFMIY